MTTAEGGSGTPKYGLQSAVVPDHASESHVDSRPETWFPNTRRPPISCLIGAWTSVPRRGLQTRVDEQDCTSLEAHRETISF